MLTHDRLKQGHDTGDVPVRTVGCGATTSVAAALWADEIDGRYSARVHPRLVRHVA